MSDVCSAHHLPNALSLVSTASLLFVTMSSKFSTHQSFGLSCGLIEPTGPLRLLFFAPHFVNFYCPYTYISVYTKESKRCSSPVSASGRAPRLLPWLPQWRQVIWKLPWVKVFITAIEKLGRRLRVSKASDSFEQFYVSICIRACQPCVAHQTGGFYTFDYFEGKDKFLLTLELWKFGASWALGELWQGGLCIGYTLMARARGFCGGDVMLRISLAPKCMDDAGGSWPCTRHSSLC